MPCSLAVLIHAIDNNIETYLDHWSQSVRDVVVGKLKGMLERALEPEPDAELESKL